MLNTRDLNYDKDTKHFSADISQLTGVKLSKTLLVKSQWTGKVESFKFIKKIEQFDGDGFETVGLAYCSERFQLTIWND